MESAPAYFSDGTKTYSLYLTKAYKLMIFMYLAFPVAGIILLLIMAFIGKDFGPIFIIGIWMLFITGFFWYGVLATPHKITMAPDGSITFISVLRRKKVNASEIFSIKPELGYMGMLFVRSSRSKVRLLNQFDEFHEFIAKLKSMNPTVTIRGC